MRHLSEEDEATIIGLILCSGLDKRAKVEAVRRILGNGPKPYEARPSMSAEAVKKRAYRARKAAGL